MLNPNEIDPKHLPSLQAAIMKNRSRLDEHLVSKLYRMAKAAFDIEDQKDAGDAKTQMAMSVHPNGTITVTATDVETGLFIVLSRIPNVPGNFLTFGKKFCQERRDAMRQNTVTKIW